MASAIEYFNYVFFASWFNVWRDYFNIYLILILGLTFGISLKTVGFFNSSII